MALRWDRGRYRDLDGGSGLPETAPRQNINGNGGRRVDGSKVDGPRLTWGELGCPREIGLYSCGPNQIRVMKIHIIVAENDPAALFTVVEFRPPNSPPEFMLGHRVA